MLVTITDSENAAPTVNAGPDQEVAEGSTVNLSGMADDADPEDSLTYSWTHNSTLTITLTDGGAILDPSFAAPNVPEDTTVEFTLTVQDGAATVSDTMLVTITDSENAAPTVNAGPDQEVAEGSTVNLSGMANDADPEDFLMPSWTHNYTLPIALGSANSLVTSFTTPNVAVRHRSRVHPDRTGRRGHGLRHDAGHHHGQRERRPDRERRPRPGGRRGLHRESVRHGRRCRPRGLPDVLVDAQLHPHA